MKLRMEDSGICSVCGLQCDVAFTRWSEGEMSAGARAASVATHANPVVRLMPERITLIPIASRPKWTRRPIIVDDLGGGETVQWGGTEVDVRE